MDWKFLPFVRTDEEADLYPEGRCSIAFLGGDGLHRSRHTLVLPPSFVWDSSLRSKWGTKLPAFGAEPVALFYPALTRQHEWYRNESNHWLKLWYTIEQRLPTFLTNRHIETITHHNNNMIIIQRKQIRLLASNWVAPATPRRSWPAMGEGPVFCATYWEALERAQWLEQSGTRWETAVQLDELDFFFFLI